LKIAVLDGAKKIGAKILVSGGGRCNVTNVRVRPEDFWGGNRNIVRRVLSAFTEKQASEFFGEIGVPLHEEQWGKLFPDSNSAKTVLNALLDEARRRGVEVLAGHRVVGVRKRENRFEVEVEGADAVGGGSEPGAPGRCVAWEADRLVLATGGKSLPKTGSDGAGYEFARALGHTLAPPTPGLAPMVLEGSFHERLSGVALEVELTVAVDEEKPIRIAGPMLWTHFGISGPAALDMSRHWHRARLGGRGVAVTASFLPGEDFPSVERRVMELAASQAKTLVRNALAGLVPASLAEAICEQLGFAERLCAGQLTREARRELVHALLEFPLRIRDSRGYNYAEVTAGGVALDEIDSATMESRKCAGLFLVGEILDVDGRIGGFNFQWAWSSAYVASMGVAKSLAGEGTPAQL